MFPGRRVFLRPMESKQSLHLLIVVSLMKTVLAELSNTGTCRLDSRELSEEKFGSATCARCYHSLPDILKKPNFNLMYLNDTIVSSNGEQLTTDPRNISSVIIGSIYEGFVFKLTTCCDAATECCELMLHETGTKDYCSRTWDGRQCWPETPAGQTAIQPCSLNSYPYYFTRPYQPLCTRYVEKKCETSGQWESKDGLEWTNYTSCGYQTLRSPVPPRSGTCRIDTGDYLDPETFRLATCARCYMFLHKDVLIKEKQLIYEPDTYQLCDPNNNTAYNADPENIPPALSDSLVSEDVLNKWITCCRSSMPCCDKMLEDPPFHNCVFCNRTWDGWQCWPDTPANVTATAECSPNAYTFSKPSCKRYAKKQCMGDGQWFKKSGGNEWTDYRTCGDPQTTKVRLDIHIGTLTISMIFLTPALACFVYYRKQLHSHRMRMHKNLFFSLFLNAFFYILLEGYVVYDELKSTDKTDIVHMNKAGCKIIVVLSRYFRTCNYMWMLCEGFYLHKQIVDAFSQQRKFWMFYLIGWVLPAFPVAIYAIIRKTMFDETCWIGVAGDYEWLFSTPLLVSLLINVGFLVDIVRVLVAKLRTSSTSQDDQIRRATRAIFFLVPLFGVHFLLFIYRPVNQSCLSLDIFSCLANFVDGIQGTLVALLFCYLNKEVWGVVQKSYYRYRLRKAPPVTSVSRPSCDTNAETSVQEWSGHSSSGKSSK